MADYDEIVRVVLAGESGVGKTTLVSRLTDEPVEPLQKSIIGVTMIRLNSRANGVRYKVQLWDPSGLDEFRKCVTAYFANAQMVILVFDMCSRDSFDAIKVRWAPDVRLRNSVCPFVLVGTKADLTDHRKVSKEEADEYAVRLGCAYVEVGSGIDLDPLRDVLRDANYEHPETPVCHHVTEHLQGPRPSLFVRLLVFLGVAKFGL